MGTKHIAPVGALLSVIAFLGAPAYAEPPAHTRSLVRPAPAAGTEPTGAEPVGGVRLGGRGLVLPTGVKAPPRTAAKSYVIADADTGEVLAAKDPHGRYLPASTLKALTALTLIPKLDKATRIKPSRNAVNQEGSAVGLVPKPLYTVEDLFKALLLVSGNDSAMALAEANGGLHKTLADMNAEAKRLQALDTVAKTPSGLDKPGQSSSAYDLALIARAGLANPDFRRYISLKTDKFPAPKGYYEIGNHNKLLWRYKGMIGVKNGWTSKALGSFVGAARRGGHTVIVAIMRHEGYFWGDVADLLDWGFTARGKVAPVGHLVDPVPEPAPLPTADAAAQSPAPAAGDADAARPVQTGEESASPAPYLLGAAALAALAWSGHRLRRRLRRTGSQN
ncbi:D-alanyl-D-alanine carboxypeptidase [Planomonospora sp. ID67723]|uniref:D-alanyl-D-alanine carboxypeptidase family protein n=1 Tax=Planomonospora sp. ID67723 TaxID=2738134 RepID=UPI001A22988E|nr:D-alanyl-D-alanine carboxypeptidase [Planomonospora sp. ID67723]MBG0827926.1 D-alanyl-D-alanine carboxypeptidase [Planomonospora sp. ID67723]